MFAELSIDIAIIKSITTTMRTSTGIHIFVLFANAILADTAPSPPLLLGPVFQPPRLLSTNFGFLGTCSQLSSTLKSLLELGKSAFGNFTPNAASVSISMTSTAQEPAIFKFNFTGFSLNSSAGGTEQVSADSVFRIGSISKLFTVYAFILHNGLDLWQRPITDYVPELRHLSQHSGNSANLDGVRWEEVTLGSLASHISGCGRDCEPRCDRHTVI